MDTVFLATSGLEYSLWRNGKGHLPAPFTTREPFTSLDEAIIALNNIPNYYFSGALVVQYQLTKSLDYAVIHDSEGVINIAKNYLGWAPDTPAGIYLSLHDITIAEYNKSSGQDLISYPSIAIGGSTAYRLLSYEQLEKEITAVHKRQPASRFIKPNKGYRRTIK